MPGANGTVVVALAALLFGVLACFFGYALWRVALAVVGAVYGYYIGVALVPSEQATLALLISLLVAIILALLAYVLWSVVAVIYGGVLGYGVGHWLGIALTSGAQAAALIGVIGAVVGVILAIFLKDRVIMLLTALSGSGAILYGAGLLLPQTLSYLYNPRTSLAALIVWLVLALVGYFTQAAMFSTRLTGTFTPVQEV